MVVGLLILILLTLLFGAGIVKGWLSNAIGLAFGLTLLVAIGIWITTTFGDYGIIYACGVLAVLLIALCAYVNSDLP